MHLITLAHLGEAQSIIERFKLERISSTLYKGQNLHCLITGEGPLEAAVSTSRALGGEIYSQVINLGIAGSLHPEFEVGSIHQIRSLYLVVEGSPQFKSFATGTEGLDLITSFERILSADKARLLQGLGKLVDREGWGVAMAAKSAQVPFVCYKLISDMAGSMDACELVREKAQMYSELLAHQLEKLLQLKASQPEALEGLDRNFYFTFTSRKKLESLLQKLTLREGKSPHEITSSPELDALRALTITPKERGLKLIGLLEERLDPFKGQLEQKLSQWKAPFHKQQIEIQTDPSWENETIRISMEVKAQAELKSKLNVLQNLDLSAFQDLRQGKL